MTARKTKPEPGPKPKFHVIDKTLFAQTDAGELQLSLAIPYSKIKLLMKIDGQPEEEVVDYILAEIMPEAAAKQLLELEDGVETLEVAMEWMNSLSARMGASMGESQGSSDSSKSTAPPSDTTSATSSASTSTTSESPSP